MGTNCRELLVRSGSPWPSPLLSTETPSGINLCRPLHAATVSKGSCVHQICGVWRTPFDRVIHHQSFSPPVPEKSLSPEREFDEDVPFRTEYQSLSVSAHCSAAGLCVRANLWWWLSKATYLKLLQNVIRSHLLLHTFSRMVVFDFPLSPWFVREICW